MDSGVRVSPFEERIVATVDGLTIYVRDYAPSPPETGAAVICLHGLTRNCRDFEVVAPRIASLGRRVIVPDMRGRGRSANDPDPAHYVPAVYAQDVLSVLDALDVREAVFVGTSMGGIVTMVTAALAPQRVAAAALNDIGVRVDPAGLARIRSYVGRGRPLATWAQATDATRDLLSAAYPDRTDDAAFWDTLVRRVCRERSDGAVEFDYDPSIALVFPEEDAPPVDMTPLFQSLAAKPVLSVRGELSDLLTQATVSEMRAVKADLQTALVPRVGHAPTLEEPEAWDALISFLATAP